MLELAFLDVGNADCIVLCPPENDALIIDAPRANLLRQWLLQRNIRHIESIYITHGHHDHFPSLQQLTTFLDDWLSQQSGTVGRIYLSNDVYQSIAETNNAHQETLDKRSQAKQARFEDALAKLRLWRKDNRLQIFRSEKTGHPHRYAELSIHILHPDAWFVTDARSIQKGNINDVALVLRVDYGSFRALLPSDIEQAGLRDMLERCSAQELHCNVLKVPHHGAWQSDSEATEHLFRQANPEVAILSVGSTNRYCHVKPALFRSLLQLQQTHRLQGFVCTQVTRTCQHTAQERVAMDRRGLSSPQPCAGTIVIEVDPSGKWSMRNQASHEACVQTIQRAACRGQADLADG